MGKTQGEQLLKKGVTVDEGRGPCLISTCPHSVTGLCRPVCAQGCVNGSCVEPDHCQCHFGFVGRNCSTECRCNRHSECAGVGAQDHCLLCRNHTKVCDCCLAAQALVQRPSLSTCVSKCFFFFFF